MWFLFIDKILPSFIPSTGESFNEVRFSILIYAENELCLSTLDAAQTISNKEMLRIVW